MALKIKKTGVFEYYQVINKLIEVEVILYFMTQFFIKSFFCKKYSYFVIVFSRNKKVHTYHKPYIIELECKFKEAA